MRGECLHVCPPPKLLITSGVMWHGMDLIRLVKQTLQLLYSRLRLRLNIRRIKVGVACVGVQLSRRLRGELAWATDKRLQVIRNIMLIRRVYIRGWVGGARGGLNGGKNLIKEERRHK